MDFFDFLFTYIPHRWLDKTKSGVMRLFGGLAKILEWADGYRGIVVDNSSTRTATELLPDLESEFGLTVNPASDIDTRRQKIIAKKRERGGAVQEPDLLSMLAAYNITATLERPENCVLIVNMPMGSGYPYKNVDDVLDGNVRAHVSYFMRYNMSLTHDVFAGAFLSTRKAYEIEPSWPISSPKVDKQVAQGLQCSYKKMQEIEPIWTVGNPTIGKEIKYGAACSCKKAQEIEVVY